MIYVPEILRSRRRGNFPQCWLAGTLSEAMFRNRVSKRHIYTINIVESCNETISLLNSKDDDSTDRCNLVLSSHLAFGIVRILSSQVDDLEKSVRKLLLEQQTIMMSDAKKKKKPPKRMTEVADYNRSLPSSPMLNLNRPFPRDQNLLTEMSPGVYRRMREMEEPNELSFSPLTGTRAELWMNDVEAIWQDAGVLPDLRPDNNVVDDQAACNVDDLDLSTLRTVQKRPSTLPNGDSPLRRKRRTLSPIGEVADQIPQIEVPMEIADEPQPLLVDTVAPMDVDNLNNFTEHAATLMEPVNQLGLEAPAIPAAEAIDNLPIEEIQDAQPRRRPRVNRKRKVDTHTRSKVQQKLRYEQIKATRVVPFATLLAVTASMSPIMRCPSTIIKFGIENLRYGRLRTFASDLLDTLAMSNKDRFTYNSEQCSAEIIQQRDHIVLPRDQSPLLPGDTSIAVVDKTGPTEVAIEPPVEIPQMEITDGANVLDTIGEPEPRLTDIENAFGPPLEVSSDAITVSIGNLLLSNTRLEDTGANDRAYEPEAGNPNASSPHLQRGRNGYDETVARKSSTSTSGHSKSKSSCEVITNVHNGTSPRHNEIVGEVITRQMFEAILEAHWGDNATVNFFTLAPVGKTLVLVALAYFMHLVDMYEEGKVELTQDVTYGPIDAKKCRRRPTITRIESYAGKRPRL